MARQSKSSLQKRRRGDKRTRTRATLIDAAAQVIGEKGYDRASLEEIAARAGMTRGAIYNNFKGKEELFLAVVTARWQPIVPPIKQGASLRQRLRILGKTVAAEAVKRRTQAAAATAFQLYVLTHRPMQSRMTRQNSATYKRMARELVKLVPAKQLPMPAELFVVVLDAVTTGLLFTYFQTPELVTEKVFVSAFEAMA